jgi:hypothetical protein
MEIEIREQILLLSDTHIMSNWGLLYPDHIGKDARGCKIKYVFQNDIQEYNQNLWANMMNRYRKIRYVIGNGDIVDGKNPFGIGHVCSNDPYEQTSMAAHYFSDFSNSTEIHLTKGTGYHCGRDLIAEEDIAEKVGSNCTYHDELVMDMAGIRIFANHHSAHTKNKAASIETKMKEVQGASDYYGKVDLLVLSHNHVYTSVSNKYMTGVMTPGWQHKTPYAVDKNLIAPSDLGWVIINIDDENKITVDDSAVIQCPNLK